jgi:hypothetical protein
VSGPLASGEGEIKVGLVYSHGDEVTQHVPRVHFQIRLRKHPLIINGLTGKKHCLCLQEKKSKSHL